MMRRRRRTGFGDTVLKCIQFNFSVFKSQLVAWQWVVPTDEGREAEG